MAPADSVCDFDAPAPDFELLGTDGRRYRRDSLAGTNGLLVMFICNHCPYVKAVLDKLVRDGAELQTYGVGTVAICSNDATNYPEDSFDNMRALALRLHFPFPYLWDETQTVAKAYGAVCTPDFFGYNGKLGLQYRGRLDDAGRSVKPDAPRELFDAMLQIARTGRGPAVQKSSIGCSIKWKTGD
jgi:peroxiredoxin